jgi:hypothetical protein
VIEIEDFYTSNKDLWLREVPCPSTEGLTVRFAAESRSKENAAGSGMVTFGAVCQGHNIIIIYPEGYEKRDGKYVPYGRLLRELKRKGVATKESHTLTATLIHESTHCVLGSESKPGPALLQPLLTYYTIGGRYQRGRQQLAGKVSKGTTPKSGVNRRRKSTLRTSLPCAVFSRALLKVVMLGKMQTALRAWCWR